MRAVWDEENNKWWFSVLDIVGILNEQDDYDKARNYWKYLKAKLKKENNELVSLTTQLKLIASDGKKYLTDTLDSDGIISLAKHFPNNKSLKFLDWFTYSNNSIDEQSKKKELIFEIVSKEAVPKSSRKQCPCFQGSKGVAFKEARASFPRKQTHCFQVVFTVWC